MRSFRTRKKAISKSLGYAAKAAGLLAYMIQFVGCHDTGAKEGCFAFLWSFYVLWRC
jgi:hypothetical protein